MSNIYEITQDYLKIMEMASDPEMNPDIIAGTFEAVEGELEVKAENYAKVIRNLEGDITAIKAEEERLARKRKAIENNIKRMKTALQEAMEITGKTKFKTELFAFGVQKNAPVVVIDTEDISKIPGEYLKVKTDVDKTLIKAAIQNGADLAGIAHLETTQSLRIR